MHLIHNVVCAQESDITAWLRLVELVADDFPGLDIKDYTETLKRNIEKRSALCVKNGDEIIGILLFSKKHQCLSCMAVHPKWRKKGVASALIAKMLSCMPTGDISVTTYREDDPKGIAPRALYQKFGFIPEALTTEFDYPVQIFVLHREGNNDRIY